MTRLSFDPKLTGTIRSLLSLIWLLSLPALAFAFNSPTLVLTVSRTAVMNDGKDNTEVIAEVRDASGNLAPDGTQVSFTTSLGQFAPAPVAATRAGNARVRLTSNQRGTATVTASAGGNFAGAFQKVDVTFTDDPAETYQGNAYVAMQSNNALVYSAGDKIVDAAGKVRPDETKGLPGAHLSYRNIEIFADELQLDCSTNIAKAKGNIVLKRGGKRLNCGKLIYNLNNGDGTAIAEVENRLRPVKLKGADLKIEVVPTPANPKVEPIPSKSFDLADISAAPLAITAREILVFPGQKLQFKRPKFYQDGQYLVSMPYYSVGLYSTQLFSDQVMSVGTQGLGLDLPFYYNLTPGSTGIFSIRHGEQAGRSSFSRRGGWSLDLNQAYNSIGSARRYTGQMGLLGMNRDDWGFRWSHSQEFNTDTRATFFADFPQHRSVNLSTNLTRQMGPLYAGINLSGNRNLTGISTSGLNSDVYLDTVPKKVGKSGYTYAIGGSAGITHVETAGVRSDISTETVQARFNSAAFRLDKETTLTNSLSFGNIWINHGSGGPSYLASLSANRAMKGANLQLSYDLTKQPNLLTDGGNHRLSMTLMAGAGSKSSLYLFASSMLDAQASSLIADFDYNFIPRWDFSLKASMQRFSTSSYRDFELGFGRSVGGRKLFVSYSTFNHRFFFDLQATHY